MALASLCRDVTNKESIMAPLLAIDGYPRTEVSFVAFIVDHKLRENSGDEARRVSEELTKMGIESEILELDWNLGGKQRSLTSLESSARKLRYQALGTACMKARLGSLLLAHHMDDVAETVMSRMVGNYLGTGLAGIRFKAKIPHCAGIYGVDDSGAPHPYDTSKLGNGAMGIEHGGVSIWRPLLGASKGDLVNFCVDRGVRWFEDPTNAQPTYTLRNAVRFLQRGDVLPLALRADRLRSMAGAVAEKNRAWEKDVEALFRETKVVLDLRTTSARVTIPQKLTSNDSALDDNLRALYLRHLFLLVAPTDEIAVQSLELAVDLVLKPSSSMEPKLDEARNVHVQIAGVRMQREGGADTENSESAVFLLSRAVPTHKDQKKCRVRLWSAKQPTEKGTEITYQPTWRLWDGRYWISVSPPATDQPYAKVTARFLNELDIANLRKRLSKKERLSLERSLKRAGVPIRYTLPVIVAKGRPTASADMETETVVALPSLGWSALGWRRSLERSTDDHWHWDIRYKYVDLDSKAPHSIGSTS